MKNPAFLFKRDMREIAHDMREVQVRLIGPAPDLLLLKKEEVERMGRPVEIDLGDETGPGIYDSLTRDGHPTRGYTVPAVVDGKKTVLYLPGSVFKKLSKEVEKYIGERRRLSCLPPLNSNSKRYKQRQARKQQRRK